MAEKFPEELAWMDGRSVFRTGLTPGSVVLQRSIITTGEEQAALSEVHARTTAERRAMSHADIVHELETMRAMQRHYADTGELPGLTE